MQRQRLTDPVRAAGINRRECFKRLLGLAGGASLATAGFCSRPQARAAGGGDGNIIRVEEDWYVKIGIPDPQKDSPQITTVLAPSWAGAGNLGVFDLNCATQPGFASGGVQLQLWYNDDMVQARSNTNWDSLHFSDEEIHYTSVMRLQNNHLAFEIINGNSQTWGAFGIGELISENTTWRNHLNSYDPECSVANSRIGFASHRVRRFVLERVRYYSANGLKSTDETPRVIHTYDPVA